MTQPAQPTEPTEATTPPGVAAGMAAQAAALAHAAGAPRPDASYDASDIQVLEGLEAVRKRPGMYIGSTGERGLHHLVYEVVDNSVDEALAGHADHIEVDAARRRRRAGHRQRSRHPGRRASPVEGKPAVEVVLTVLHAGGKFGGGGYTVSGGLHGVGVSVVNALSSKLEVEIRRDGHVWTQSYHLGVPDGSAAQGRGHRRRPAPRSRSGPTPDIFETTEYDFETLSRRLPGDGVPQPGLTIMLRDERPSVRGGRRSTTRSRRPPRPRSSTTTTAASSTSSTTSTPARTRSTAPSIDVRGRVRGHRRRACRLEVAMQWNTGFTESVYTFANTINTHEGGTHEEGFRAALTTLVNKFARDWNMLKEKDANLTGDDIREGLTAIVRVKLGRAAVRGPDQDQARQHRGEDVRAEGRQRPARRRGSRRTPARARRSPARRSGRGDRPGSRPARPATSPATARVCSAAAACRAS